MSPKRCEDCTGDLGEYCESIRPGGRGHIESPMVSDSVRAIKRSFVIDWLIDEGCLLPRPELDNQFTPPK
jgi:hypothetical protein